MTLICPSAKLEQPRIAREETTFGKSDSGGEFSRPKIRHEKLLSEKRSRETNLDLGGESGSVIIQADVTWSSRQKRGGESISPVGDSKRTGSFPGQSS